VKKIKGSAPRTRRSLADQKSPKETKKKSRHEEKKSPRRGRVPQGPDRLKINQAGEPVMGTEGGGKKNWATKTLKGERQRKGPTRGPSRGKKKARGRGDKYSGRLPEKKGGRKHKNTIEKRQRTADGTKGGHGKGETLWRRGEFRRGGGENLVQWAPAEGRAGWCEQKKPTEENGKGERREPEKICGYQAGRQPGDL